MIIDQTTEEILESLKAIEAKINAKTSQKSSEKSERAEIFKNRLDQPKEISRIF